MASIEDDILNDLKKQFKVEEGETEDVEDRSYELDDSVNLDAIDLESKSGEDISDSSADDINSVGELCDAQGNVMDYNTALQHLQHKFDIQSNRYQRRTVM